MFSTKDSWVYVRNTLLYNIFWIVLGLVLSVTLAILLSELTQKRVVKMYQTFMFFPYFLSWVVASYFVLAFLDPTRGLVHIGRPQQGAKQSTGIMNPNTGQ